jgi:3-methyl-2-oxobutanoate hydroxymethyltransferase
MVTLAEAVRRGAPNVFLVGDMPYESLSRGPEPAIAAARRFMDVAGCDAIKAEVGAEDVGLLRQLVAAGVACIAHLGLRPQQVLTPDGYRAQARDWREIEPLVDLARRMVDAGAAMLLIEAVPNEAAQAVVNAVAVPVIGCGAGPACDGHVLVTQDMLGLGAERPPRFVPALANIREQMLGAMRSYVLDIEYGRYPAPQHVYPMRGEHGPGAAVPPRGKASSPNPAKTASPEPGGE